MKNFSSHCRKIVLQANSGTVINECVREAVIHALEEQCEVSFIFNSKKIVIDPQEIVTAFIHKWEGK